MPGGDLSGGWSRSGLVWLSLCCAGTGGCARLAGDFDIPDAAPRAHHSQPNAEAGSPAPDATLPETGADVVSDASSEVGTPDSTVCQAAQFQ
jgi:hypothetical protein